jgi:hypothetical protein
MPVCANVLFASDLSDEGVAQLIEDFQSVGVTAELRQVSPRRALAEIAWLALAVIPLKPFFDQLANDFADDAYQRLKTFIAKLFRLHRPPPTEPPRVLLLQDSTTGIQVVLEPDLPARAYQQLLSFDFATLRRGPLHYDQHRHRWRSELDEADNATSLPHA